MHDLEYKLGAIREMHFPEAEPFLFSRGTNPAEVSQWKKGGHALGTIARAWEAELFRFNQFFTFSRLNLMNPLHHPKELLKFMRETDLAKRAANGLRLSLLEDDRIPGTNSEYGKQVHRAFNNPDLVDHNHSHNRRTERWLDAFFMELSEIQQAESVRPWINSAYLFAYFHDIDQLLIQQDNLSRDENERINTKKGHALAAAVQILALKDKYAQERGISKEEAERICAGAAYMMMRHDEPEIFDKVTSADMNATKLMNAHVIDFNNELKTAADKSKVKTPEERFLESFKKNEIDLTTITPSQMITLLKLIKGIKDEAKEDHSKTNGNSEIQSYGLNLLFEAEYANKLAAFADDNTPIFGKTQISQNVRSSLNLAAEAAVRADVMEMIAPPEEQLPRKIQAPIAHGRPFFRSGTPIDMVVNAEGNIDPEIDSDTRRNLWEFVHVDPMEQSVLSNNSFIQSINRDNAIMGILAFRRIGTHVFGGIEEFEPIINAIYERRMQEVAEKAIKKSRQGKNVNIQITRMLGHLEKERRKMLEELDDKNRIQMKLTKEQGISMEQQKLEFEQLCDTVLVYLCEKYQVSQEQLQQYLEMDNERKTPPRPYGAYDSVGSLLDIRTLFEPAACVSKYIRNPANNN